MSEDAERRIVALEREVAKLSTLVLELAKTAAPKAAAKKKGR